METKLKKVICVLCAALMLINIAPLKPADAAAPAIPIVTGAGTWLLELLGIVGGVTVISNGYADTGCICIGIKCVQSQSGYQCITSAVQDSKKANYITLDDFGNIEKEVIRTAQRSLDDIINSAKKEDIMRVLPPQPKQTDLPILPWLPDYLGDGVAMLPLQTTAQNLRDWLELMSPGWADIMNKQADGESWCYEHDKLDLCSATQPITPPHPLLEGYCEETGLPIIRRTYNTYATNSSYMDTDADYFAIYQHCVPTFIHEGKIMSFEVVPKAANGNRDDVIYLLSNGVRELQLATIDKNWGYSVLGFFMQTNKKTGEIERDKIYLARNITSYANKDYRVHITTNFYTLNKKVAGNTTQTKPKSPAATEVKLEPNNAVTSLDDLMAEIRKISNSPDRNGDEIVILLPMLEPQFYPQIQPEHFPEFIQTILENLRIEHIIMPGHEIKEKGIDTKTLPEFPPLPPITKPSTDNTRQLEEIRREQERQTRLMEEQNKNLKNIEDLNRNLSQKIGDAVIGQPSGLDFTPLEELKAVSGVFPFSIPWDLTNAFKAMFGNSTAAAPPPVFEVDLTDTMLKSKIKIDFAEYEKMAIVVRWGIMGLFVVGLVMATSRLIKW